jgi:hypothetical protein
MQDLIYVALILAFFVIAALFVKGCDLIIGPDEEALGDAGSLEDEEAEDFGDLVKKVRS